MWIEQLSIGIDFTNLAQDQDKDPEMRELLQTGTALQLKQVQFPGTDINLSCDVSTSTARPFVTKSFRRAAFNWLHQLSHPGAKATAKLVSERYVWPHMQADCKTWTRACI